MTDGDPIGQLRHLMEGMRPHYSGGVARRLREISDLPRPARLPSLGLHSFLVVWAGIALVCIIVNVDMWGLALPPAFLNIAILADLRREIESGVFG